MPQYTWRAVASEQDERCRQNAASVQVRNFESIPNYLHTALCLSDKRRLPYLR